uniref:ANK_REP_REGION domain-containing protein n=1 Tax=Macrostomum lignano TaxID=282301 RepID=A0A1I8FY75_9PLAT
KNDGGNEQSTEPKETLTNDNHSDSGKSDSRKRSSKSGADDSQLASKSDNGSSPASPKRSRSATRCSAAPTIPDNERSRGQGTDLSQDQRSFADVARGTGQRQPQQLSYEEHRYHPINQDQSPEQQWQQWTKNLELLHFATVAKAAPFFHGPYSFKFEDISALLDRILPPETPCDSMLSGLAQLPKDLPESAKAWYSGMISSDREFKPEYLLLLPAYHILQYGEELHSSDRIPLRQAFLDLLKSRGSASLFDWCGLTKEFDRLMKNCGPRMNNSVELVKQRLMRYRRVDPLIPRCYAAFMDLRLFDTDLEPSDWLPASNKLALIGYNLAQPPPGTIKFGFEASLPDKHSAFCNFYNTLTAQLQSGAFPQPELELCLELHCQTFKIFCSCVSDKGRNPLSKHSKRPADTISCLLAAVNLTIVLCSATSDGVEAAGGASGVPVVEQLSLLEKQVFRSEDKGDPRTIELLSQVFATLQDCKPSLAKPCYSALDSFVSCLLFKTDLDGVIALMEGKKLQNERLKESVSSVAVDKITHESSSKGNLLSRLFSRLFSSSNEPLRKIGRILLAQFNLEEPGPNAVLKFSLTWKLCAQITCHEDYKKLKSKMEPEFASLLKRCLSAVRQTLKELCQGPQATPMDTAKLLIGKQAELLDYHRELDKQKRLKGVKAKDSQLRAALETFKQQICVIDSGVEELHDIAAVRKPLAALQRMRIGDLTVQQAGERWALQLVAFGIDEKHRSLLANIRKSGFFSRSASFAELLRSRVRSRYCGLDDRLEAEEVAIEEIVLEETEQAAEETAAEEQCLDANAVLDTIQVAVAEWKRQVKRLKDEDMTVDAAKRFLGEEIFQDAKKLEAELATAGLIKREVDSLRRKINFIRSKTKNDRLCAALCTIYQNYSIDMDDKLKDLTEVEATADTLKFKDIRVSKLEANELLKDMLREPMLLEVLEAFGKAHELVKWTRQHLKKDDLKTFFDLAMIYTGDAGAMEQAKIECFYQAVVGFEPLIYDLLSCDGQVTLQQIQQNSQRVLKPCQACAKACQPGAKDCQNCLLVQHLLDSSDRVDWLQEVNSSKGTVERSTVSRVKAVATAGKLRVRARDPTEFELEIDGRTLALEDVQDLQSKLMLIIGQSDADQAMFNSFIELTNLFARLVSLCDGLGSDCCPLFENLTVEALLKPGSVDNLTLKLSQRLRPRSDRFTVADPINGIRQAVEFLLTCREEWQQRVAAERRQHPVLNLFGARQLRFLQTHLAEELLEQDRPCPSLLHLLRFAVPNATAEEAVTTLQAVLGASTDSAIESPCASPCESAPSYAAGVAEVLTPVWRRFLDGTGGQLASFRSLSFSQLAQFLDNLEAPRMSPSLAPTPLSMLPLPGLTAVSMPEGQQLLTCLDAFRLAFNRLPLPAEVLCCSRRTEREELRLFLDRALSPSAAGRPDRLFVLLWAERLPYELSCCAESHLTQLLNQFSSGASSSSRLLAVLTEAGRRSGGPLCAALGHFVQDAVRVPSEREVVAWACGQLGGAESAAQVTLVTSARPGMGKSLRCQRLAGPAKPRIFSWHAATFEPNRLYEFLCSADATDSEAAVTRRVFHLDIAREVREDLDEALAQLLLLGALRSSKGFVWRRSPRDVFLLEHSPLRLGALQTIRFLPTVRCVTPAETLGRMRAGAASGSDGCFWDELSLADDWIQRPARHLLRQVNAAPVTAVAALETLTGNCGLRDPSWLELATFCRFLDRQLRDFEESDFCSAAAQEDLPGFRQFVVDSMLLMAKDFATRSLRIADESASAGTGRAAQEEDAGPERIEQFALRRHWEDEDHPYLFFNHDCTFSFVGFSVDAAGNLIGVATGQVLRRGVMTQALVQALVRNRAPLSDNFENRSRTDKLDCLRRILGSENTADPDPSYELTADNARKMLAVYMRFRCNLPVVVMGETGCGKTRLVRFLARLMLPQSAEGVDNMLVLKVHGGTTERAIEDAVRRAERLARKNSRLVPGLFTILFFDEVNSTNAVGLIKEVMCDRRLHGHPVDPDGCLRFVAACNPYRRHTDEMIDRLESSGLGYRVRKEETADRFGDLPMRHLVYRVRPMPLSLVSLLWDFGSLSSEAESQYALRMLKSGLPAEARPHADAVADAVCESQRFMRGFSDESRFVSLREVDKALRVMNWAFGYRRLHAAHREPTVNKITCALIVAMSVCYLSRLSAAFKEDYIKLLAKLLRRHTCFDNLSPLQIEELLKRCQEVFISNEVPLPPGISKNGALRENVFMMVVCISLRLPLFLVGKPGSSKSLAKTIVRSRMLGRNSASDAYKELPNTHMLAFQCSPWSTSDGIIQTFQQCAMLQRGKPQDEFVAVVVLEEVGLAEDSPDMPLKSLHPLLEDGCIEEAGPADEDSEESLPPECRKVAFVGISNWALDPAKMNRGLYVQRDVPDRNELVATARGICRDGKSEDWDRLAEFYLGDSRRSATAPDAADGAAVTLRCATKNFGGLEEVDPVKEFLRLNGGQPDDAHRGLAKLVLDAALETRDPEERYLLLVTQNLAGFKALLRRPGGRQSTVIFGSSFPHDQLYTKVCRDINKIKLAMERGETVVLMNMDSLYESLYDVLNQYYETCGGQRYVDLGLGTHRLKCKIHENFRIVVVADRDTVMDRFPIPLINRMEKHRLCLDSLLNSKQKQLCEAIVSYLKAELLQGQATLSDVLIGYHDDSVAALLLELWPQQSADASGICETVIDEAKLRLRVVQRLMLTASPDCYFRLAQDSPLLETAIDPESAAFRPGQRLAQRLRSALRAWPRHRLLQVTSFDQLMSEAESQQLAADCPELGGLISVNLSSFETEGQFSDFLRAFVGGARAERTLLLQLDAAHAAASAGLVASAKHCIEGVALPAS